MGKRISAAFFAKKASLVAPKMLGLKLCTPSCSAVLFEVEAYEGKNDPASHAYNFTKRSRLMHETHAHWYVYFIYGNHHCTNITCGKNSAGAVLIREAVPLTGIGLMKKRRNLDKRLKNKENFGGGGKTTQSLKGISDGPGKLCQAMGIGKKFNGLPLGGKLWLEKLNAKEKKLLWQKLRLLNTTPKHLQHNRLEASSGKNSKLKTPKLKVIALPRVGITKAKNLKWRFRLAVK